MDLKHCPYCGGTTIIVQNETRKNNTAKNVNRLVYFACMRCKSYGPDMPTVEEAAAAWNKRYSAPRLFGY